MPRPVLAILLDSFFAQFLTAVSDLRYKKAIPPEDKTEATPTSSPPPHARDTWAFGQFIIATLDKANLNGVY